MTCASFPRVICLCLSLLLGLVGVQISVPCPAKAALTMLAEPGNGAPQPVTRQMQASVAEPQREVIALTPDLPDAAAQKARLPYPAAARLIPPARLSSVTARAPPQGA